MDFVISKFLVSCFGVCLFYFLASGKKTKLEQKNGDFPGGGGPKNGRNNFPVFFIRQF